MTSDDARAGHDRTRGPLCPMWEGEHGCLVSNDGNLTLPQDPLEHDLCVAIHALAWSLRGRCALESGVPSPSICPPLIALDSMLRSMKDGSCPVACDADGRRSVDLDELARRCVEHAAAPQRDELRTRLVATLARSCRRRSSPSVTETAEWYG